MRVETRLGKDEMLRVFGPALIKVEKGIVSVLGAELEQGDSFPVDEFRSYVVRAEADALLVVELGAGARLEPSALEEEPYSEWVSVADEIVDECRDVFCRIAVIGPVDAGKTSIVALIANRALAAGVRPAVVDCDIGQADLGPPGFTGLAFPSSWVSWLRRLDPEFLRFVGSIEPAVVSEELILACRELVEKASTSSKADVVIVDTDGWIEGLRALKHKLALLRALRASHVVVVGSSILAEVVRGSLKTRVYELPQPLVAYTRSPSARRMLRQSNYKRFLGNAHIETIDLKSVTVASPCLARLVARTERSQIYEDEDSVIVEYPGGVCVYAKRPLKPQDLARIQKRYGRREVAVIDLNNIKYTLSALRKPDGSDCPALLLDVDIQNATAKLLTTCHPPFVELHLGRVRLSESLLEISRGRIIV
ncbi:MAG: Clp1/GlmU family protein [Acidilobaceae archaeon]